MIARQQRSLHSLFRLHLPRPTWKGMPTCRPPWISSPRREQRDDCVRYHVKINIHARKWERGLLPPLRGSLPKSIRRNVKWCWIVSLEWFDVDRPPISSSVIRVAIRDRTLEEILYSLKVLQASQPVAFHPGYERIPMAESIMLKKSINRSAVHGLSLS